VRPARLPSLRGLTIGAELLREVRAMSLREYRDLEQRSDEWYEARCGMVTASVVRTLVTPKTMQAAANADVRGLAALIAAERVTGHVDPTYVNADMWRGIESERFAVEKYCEHHAEVTPCGFMVRSEDNWQLGYSPDGLVGDDGLIEIKSPRQKGHLATVLDGEVPDQHMAQIQAGLFVSGRAWCDFISYHGGMHMWVKRVTPDPHWHEVIAVALVLFEATVEQMVADYRAAVEGLPMTERLDLVVI